MGKIERERERHWKTERGGRKKEKAIEEGIDR
jgi:hypothetical protein